MTDQVLWILFFSLGFFLFGVMVGMEIKGGE
jgi:hypothetical protein